MGFYFMEPLFSTELSDTQWHTGFCVPAQEATTGCTDLEFTNSPQAYSSGFLVKDMNLAQADTLDGRVQN